MTNYGYWIFGRDMLNVNLQTLKNNGFTDIFLNYFAFATHGENKVLNWIKEANKQGINIHIWVQAFYDGEWHNPVVTDLNPKKKEIKKYANMEGVKGIHLDYLRYPGNAYKTSNASEAITKFVKEVRDENPNIILTCAVMPEESCKYYYGQDIEALGKIVDAIVPMQYKGNYNQGTNWLASITKNFSSKATIWSGLQAYKSDDDTTILSVNELKNDSQTCINNGAKGIILFRYGLSPNISFKTEEPKNNKTISNTNAYKMAEDIKKHVEAGKSGLPANLTYDGITYSWHEMMYIMPYMVKNPFSNICEIPSLVKPSSPWKGDPIDEQIKKDDFIKQAENIVNYVTKNNGQIPNYVTTIKSRLRVNANHYTYCMAKILVWFKNHDRVMPLQCLYNSSDMKQSGDDGRLKDYITTKGCSGMGQCTPYNCAPNSLQQCFYRLTGILVDESTIAGWARTTSSGTSHQGIETAVAQFNKVYGKNIKLTWKYFSEVGWDGLQKAIENGAVLNHILYRLTDGHYEVPLKIDVNNVIVLNSLGDRCNYPAYCGYIETRSKATHLSYINGISQKSIAILTNG